ncbi:MAG: SH3 domain-containing protein [Candidatus Aminicenantia bacterium]
MKNKNFFNKKGKIFIIFLVLLFSAVLIIQAADIKIRVVVDKANVRLKPDLGSVIVGKASIGQVFEVIEKEGEWYLINLPPDEQGFVVAGYVHRSVVEEIGEKIPPREEKPAVAPPPTPPPAPVYQPSKPAKKIFFIRANFGYGGKSYSYDNNWSFTEYQETGNVNESYEIDSSGMVFEAGIGFFFTQNIGLEVSFAPGSGKTKGTFSASFPHPFYFNQHRNVSWEEDDLGYSESEINLNLILGFPAGEMLNIYFSGGGTYFLNVKAENLKEISKSEAYPYNAVTTTPSYDDYSKSGFGFNAGGGIDFFLMENLGLNLNVRYSMGTVKIDVEGTEIELKPGGLRATAGIKLVF